MKKIIFFAFVVASFFYSCGNPSANQQAAQLNDSAAVDKPFDVYKESFIENLWKLYPGWASSQGYHKYDSVLLNSCPISQ